MDETLLQLFRELAASYDPTLDTSDGSRFYLTVIQPLLTRIGPDPLAGDPEAFIAAYLDAAFDGELDTSALSDLRQILIRPGALINAALRREIAANRATRALGDYEQMTREELNARLSDFFITLRDGGTVELSVRVYFRSPQARTFTPTTRFYTGAGLAFYPTAVQSITTAEMSFQQEGSLYYVDVDVRAEESGSAYVVPARAVIGVDGIPGVVKVANLRAAAPVQDDETKEAAVDRARDSITQRNLTTLRGIKVTLPEDLGAFDDILPVGAGHALMERDFMLGPATIGGIPGGVRGRRSPSLAVAQGVHIGAHTDVYLRRGRPSSDSMDISALTDTGYQVFSSISGYTAGGPDTNTWQDATGNFVANGVRVGDYLMTSSEAPRRISAVNAYTLTFEGSALSGGRFNQTYGIYRRTAGYVTVSLSELVGMDAGSPVLDGTGAPVRPIPGDQARGALVVGGSQVLATENVCKENVALPLIRVSTVELLDPTTLEPTDIFLPQADLLGTYVSEALAGGDGSTRATGKVRCYFRDPVNCYAAPGTSFRIGSWYYRVRARALDVRGHLSVVARVYDVGGGTFRVILPNMDYTTGSVTVHAGDRISGTVFVGTFSIVSASFDGTHTVLQVREQDVTGWYSASTPNESATVCPGTLQADVSNDPTLGLYYLELDVEASAVGAGGNAAVGTEVTHLNGVLADGWYLRSPKANETFSTRDLPYLQTSNWPDDSTWIADPGADYAIRVTYTAAPGLAEIQTYVEDEDNAAVGEDILIRHFIPAYVRATILSNAASPSAATTAVENALWDLTSGEPLQVSDLVDVLRDEGSTYTRLPVQLVVLKQSVGRAWSLVLSEDQVEATEAHYFSPDPGYLSVSGA